MRSEVACNDAAERRKRCDDDDGKEEKKGKSLAVFVNTAIPRS